MGKVKTKLKLLLGSKGMTQKELSEATNIAEYKVSQLCSGKSRNIQLSTAIRICKFLECSLDDAFSDSLLDENED